MVTGLPVPQTPVTAQVYAGYGFQFMKEYEDGEEGDGELDGSTNSGADAVDPAQTNPILAVKSVSERDSLLQAAERMVSRSHVDPAAPATACKACEVRAGVPWPGFVRPDPAPVQPRCLHRLSKRAGG